MSESQMNILKHIHGGGMVALAVYGKRSITMEVVSKPRCVDAGLRRIDELVDAGLARYGDKSPYKSGYCKPLLLTDAGLASILYAGTRETKE